MKSRNSYQNNSKKRLWALAGMGATFTSEMLAGAVLGWIIDSYTDKAPWGILTGCLAGILIAGRNFKKNVENALKDQNTDKK